jgi:hypothetical protein
LRLVLGSLDCSQLIVSRSPELKTECSPVQTQPTALDRTLTIARGQLREIEHSKISGSESVKIVDATSYILGLDSVLGGHDLGEAGALRNQEADVLDDVGLGRVPRLLSPSRQNVPIAAISHSLLLVLEEGLAPEAPAIALETLTRLALRGSSFVEQGLNCVLKLTQFWVVLQAVFQGHWEVAGEAQFVEFLQALEVLNVAVAARLPQQGVLSADGRAIRHIARPKDSWVGLCKVLGPLHFGVYLWLSSVSQFLHQCHTDRR